MDNILVTGCKGQLGSEIRDLASDISKNNFFFTDISNLDITDHNAVKEFVYFNDISIIINCAAYTAVDKAESEPLLADSINHLAVANFARLSKEKNIKFVHISTDFVFDGFSAVPYSEKDIPNPLSRYGRSKLDGETAIKKVNPPNTIIIRTSWVFSKHGKNFVNTMLNLSKNNNEIKVVNNQFGSPTSASDLACTILEILPKIKNNNVEIYHYSNSGYCSWYDFAKKIFELSNIMIKIKPINSKEFERSASTPNYSVLNCNKIRNRFSLHINSWQTSLKVILN